VYAVTRCPRCGGYRLRKTSPTGVMLVYCVACGLMTEDQALPVFCGEPRRVAHLWEGRHICSLQVNRYVLHQGPMNHP
jgi:hypothetical protein